jgi:chromosome segregation ATPase
MESDRVKVAIKDQLAKFDVLSKQIERAKAASNMDPGEPGRLKSEVDGLRAKTAILKGTLSAEERTTYNMLSENLPNLSKRLDKQNAKVARTKDDISALENKINALMNRMQEIEQLNQVSQQMASYQESYKQCFTNLMNLRNRFPKAYEEAEQESGIYFLTTPKPV